MVKIPPRFFGWAARFSSGADGACARSNCCEANEMNTTNEMNRTRFMILVF
jgi:hypothetical protein